MLENIFLRHLHFEKSQLCNCKCMPRLHLPIERVPMGILLEVFIIFLFKLLSICLFNVIRLSPVWEIDKEIEKVLM